MSSRPTSRKKPSQRSVSGNDSGRLKVYSMMFVCVVVLVSGFFFAARQHFSSIEYGMRNSRLRKQLDDLQAEKRRLLLAREVSLSPAEIKKAARKFGLGDTGSESVQLASAVTVPKPATVTPASAAKAPADPKTVYAVVAAAYLPTTAKSPKIDKAVKRETAEKDKKDRTQVSALDVTR